MWGSNGGNQKNMRRIAESSCCSALSTSWRQDSSSRTIHLITRSRFEAVRGRASPVHKHSYRTQPSPCIHKEAVSASRTPDLTGHQRSNLPLRQGEAVVLEISNFLLVSFTLLCGADPGLSFHTTELVLSEAFAEFGQVLEATIVIDRVENRSRGFGFVTYASEEEAQKAVTEMHGKVLDGRVIYVENARPRGLPIVRGPPEW